MRSCVCGCEVYACVARSMCVCIFICSCMCMCVYSYIYIYICLCKYVHECVRACIFIVCIRKIASVYPLCILLHLYVMSEYIYGCSYL